MPKIKLTQEEQDDLNFHGGAIQATTQQLATLALQR